MSAAGDAGRRWAGRAGTIGFVLAALALARAVGDQLPDPIEAYEEPFVHRTTLAHPVTLSTAKVVAADPHVGRQLDVGYQVYDTPGVWVMVDLGLKPTREDQGLFFTTLVDREGRRYQPSRSGARSCGLTGPDLREVCSVAFEVPPEAVPGAELSLSTRSGDLRYGEVVEIPLGLDAADVEQGRRATAPLTPIENRTATP